MRQGTQKRSPLYIPTYQHFLKAVYLCCFFSKIKYLLWLHTEQCKLDKTVRVGKKAAQIDHSF